MFIIQSPSLEYEYPFINPLKMVPRRIGKKDKNYDVFWEINTPPKALIKEPKYLKIK
jgi:hypothetical protein